MGDISCVCIVVAVDCGGVWGSGSDDSCRR